MAMEVYTILCTRMYFTKIIVMSLDFAEIKKISKTIPWWSHTGRIKPFDCYILIIYLNKSRRLVLDVDGFFLSISCMK